jgi:hypothetical protein
MISHVLFSNNCTSPQAALVLLLWLGGWQIPALVESAREKFHFDLETVNRFLVVLENGGVKW